MKNNLFLTLIITLLSLGTTLAQDFYHSAGVGLSSIMYNQEYTTPLTHSSYSGSTATPGFVYNPTLSFEINRKMSFNLAAYPMLGFSVNSREGSSFGIELPVAGELFFGDMDDIGGFIGAGFAFGSSADDYWSGSILGPQLSAGGQLEIQGSVIKGRIGYTIGLNESPEESGIVYTTDKRNMLSLSLLYPLGQ
ncbi:MAG: hypothetical protein ACPGYY_01695 [Bacteroidia bacterium]